MPSLDHHRARRLFVSASLMTTAWLAWHGPALATEPHAARVENSETRIAFLRRHSKLLLHADQTARALGWQAKVVAENRLLTLCRDGGRGICVPVRLDHIASARTDAGLFVEADALAKPMRFRVEDRRAGATLVRLSEARLEAADIPGYNAAWGPGRGFRVGDTLPDIPLIDLEGHEIRFSHFLGNQAILYCWASW